MTAGREAVQDEDTQPLPEPWRAQLEATWLRLFDPAELGLHERPAFRKAGRRQFNLQRPVWPGRSKEPR